jgi:hypothetical protein
MEERAQKHRSDTQPVPEPNEERGRATEAELQEDDDQPKRHGDALLDGSGNRHGVHDAEARPDTCD